MKRAPGFPEGKRSRGSRAELLALVSRSSEIQTRLVRLRKFSRTIRTNEYHITNKCNLRCTDCWFYEYEFDLLSKEVTDIESWKRFAAEQASKGITHALLIGGEPTLYIDRIEEFVEAFPYVTVSTNGLHRISSRQFPNVAIAISLFGGVGIDDRLRGTRPSGARLSGLFSESLKNYKDDKRATFIYALTETAIEEIEDTVKAISDNGNVVTFNYYSEHKKQSTPKPTLNEALLEEAIRIKRSFPQVVVCDELYLETLISGSTHFGKFGYEVCPSVSTSHPSNKERIRNGNPVLPFFDVYAADLRTLALCCTSGRCERCRDSQAIYSWLLLNWREFLDGEETFLEWLDLAESYWSQFVWSPYHRSARGEE